MQSNENPYDFILDPSLQHKKNPGLQNPKQRKLVAVVFVAIVILAVSIVASLLLSSGKQNNQDTLEVAAYQTELLRLCDAGLKSAKTQEALGKVATLQAFISTDLTATTEYLTANGVDLETLKQQTKKNSDIDEQLESASQRDNYDEVLLAAVESTAAAYKQSLQTALNDASGTKKKALLETAATNILSFENVDLD